MSIFCCQFMFVKEPLELINLLKTPFVTFTFVVCSIIELSQKYLQIGAFLLDKTHQIEMSSLWCPSRIRQKGTLYNNNYIVQYLWLPQVDKTCFSHLPVLAGKKAPERPVLLWYRSRRTTGYRSGVVVPRVQSFSALPQGIFLKPTCSTCAQPGFSQRKRKREVRNVYRLRNTFLLERQTSYLPIPKQLIWSHIGNFSKSFWTRGTVFLRLITFGEAEVTSWPGKNLHLWNGRYKLLSTNVEKQDPVYWREDTFFSFLELFEIAKPWTGTMCGDWFVGWIICSRLLLPCSWLS